MYRKIGVLGVMLAALVVALGAGACGDDGDSDEATATPTSAPPAEAQIAVTDVWARNAPAGMATPGSTTPSGGMSGNQGSRGAAYMVITNKGAEGDALVAASSRVSAVTEIHESVMDGDQVQMRQVERIDVPAGGRTELKPGGYHVMFIDLNQALLVGDEIEIELTFEKAGKVVVKGEVRGS